LQLSERAGDLPESCGNCVDFSRQARVFAVIVSFRPDLERLLQQLEVLLPQVAGAVLVDNGSPRGMVDLFGSVSGLGAHVCLLGDNMGIAHAQNVGIEFARRQCATHVLLMDQDSVPAQDMVACLLSATSRLAALGRKVAAVGPRYVDEHQQNAQPFVRIRGLKVARCGCAERDAIVEVDCLIASGALIPLTVLQRVGGMREDLFIDYVDTEWSLRASRHGFQSFGVCNASMGHALGGAPYTFMGRKVPMHSPLRHYYQVRNAIRLCCESFLPLRWRAVFAYQALVRFVFHSLFAIPRRQHLRMMTLGVAHGLANRLGRLDVEQTETANERNV